MRLQSDCLLWRQMLVAIALIGLTTASRAEQVTVSESELVASSAVVIVGTVISTQSYWDGDHELIYTDYMIQTEAPLKGSTPERQITVTILGGERDGVGLYVSDQPYPNIGGRYVLFLQSMPDGHFSPSYGSQGALLVEDEAMADTGENLPSVLSRLSALATTEQ